MKALKKDNLMPAAVLGAICLIVALVLSLLNMLTAPVIEQTTKERQRASLVAVFPADSCPSADVESDPMAVTLTGTAATTVKGVYRETHGYGYAVLLSTSTAYTTAGTSMNITVAISTDGRVLGVKLTSYNESKNIGTSTYPQTYVGRDTAGVADAPLVSGATDSSAAFRDALSDAMKTLAQNGLIGGETP